MNRKTVLPLAALAALLTLCSCEGPTRVSGPGVTLSSGLKYWDLRVGTGAAAEPGKRVVVNYTGWLTNGKKFDSSAQRYRPFVFTLGAGHVIRGWDEGIVGMKTGGKRQLLIPPALAYGSKGAPPEIPPDSTLVFDVELLEVR